MKALEKWKVTPCFSLKISDWILWFFAFPYDEKRSRERLAGTEMQNLKKKSIYKKPHSRSSSITYDKCIIWFCVNYEMQDEGG
jgi:hypothetical protein